MPCRIDLFCEDAGHEAVGRALVARVAREEGVSVTIRVATARLGIPRLKAELRAFQAVVKRAAGTPDILVALIDANSVGAAARRAEIQSALDGALFPVVVIGCPDPCVERWLMADPDALVALFGIQPQDLRPVRGDVWKSRLVHLLTEADEIVAQGGAEFADDIIGAMDLYRAGRNETTIKAFIDDLRSALRQACPPTDG